MPSLSTALRRGFVVPVVLASLVSLSPAASAGSDASSATASQVASSGNSTDLPSGTAITLVSGATAHLPKAWSKMSVSDLAHLGIVPNQGPQSVTTAPTPRTAHPNDASGCNANVCIWVYGNGLTVNKWDTTGNSSVATCTFSVYWAPGNAVFSTGQEVCGGPGLYYGYEADVPFSFVTTTQVCVSWVYIPGKPCETVKPKGGWF